MPDGFGAPSPVAVRYRRDRGHPFIDYLTPEQAVALFHEKAADPNARLAGDLECFTFFEGWHESTGPMVRTTVERRVMCEGADGAADG